MTKNRKRTKRGLTRVNDQQLTADTLGPHILVQRSGQGFRIGMQMPDGRVKILGSGASIHEALVETARTIGGKLP